MTTAQKRRAARYLKRRAKKYDRRATQAAQEGNWNEALRNLQTSVRAKYRREEILAAQA